MNVRTSPAMLRFLLPGVKLAHPVTRLSSRFMQRRALVIGGSLGGLLADALRDAGDDVPAALAQYESRRQRFNAAVVAHGRELGAWLQGIDTPAARRHHTPEAVMAEIAVDREYP